MKVIGLCGGSGSGKGLVCKILSEYSVPIIDTDGLYREMTSGDSPCLRALRNEFGESIIGADGSLDHSVLRNIVFSSADSRERRARLNEIAHGYILDETRNIISQNRERGAEAIVVDAPLLYESGFDAECDFTLCIIADEITRVERIIARDGISRDDAIRRIKGQISNDELVRRADFVIENNGDVDELRRKVIEFYNTKII